MSVFSTLYRYYFMKGALMAKRTEKETPRYNSIPKQVSRKDFNRYILPHPIENASKVRNRKLSFYKIFNYILYVFTYRYSMESTPNTAE